MTLNSAINTVYFTAWAKLPAFSREDIDDERGITTLEWIGMGMVMVVMLMIFWNVFKSKTESTLAQPIMSKLGQLITQAFGVRG